MTKSLVPTLRFAMASSRRGSPRPILASCSTVHAAHDGLAEALLALLPLWAQAFGLSLTQTGLLKSVFYGAMTVGQIPAGLIAERLGERRLLALGTLGTAVGWLLLAEANGFQALLAALVVAGARVERAAPPRFEPREPGVPRRQRAFGPRRLQLRR